MEILSPVSVRDSNNTLRKVARVQNTDGDLGDTLFVGNTTPTQPKIDGDVWLSGGGANSADEDVTYTASGFTSMNHTGTSKVDIPGVVVAPLCTGAPLIFTASMLMQLALTAGNAAGTRIQGQAWITDETGRSWNIALLQGYITTTVAVVSLISGNLVIPNVTPGRHQFKLQISSGYAEGTISLFSGSFSGDPVWETHLSVREVK